MPETPPRLLVTGVGPVPPERPDRLFAPGVRIWGIARELARAGHPVRLICARFGETSGERPSARRFDLEPADEVRLPVGQTFPVERGDWAILLGREARNFGAQAAVGSTDVMNHALARAGLEIPIWMDYFGDPMAERQMIALRLADDAGLADQWNVLAPALIRADRLSGCSTDQCAALLGELGAVGRLNRLTAGEPLVHRLPPWIEPIPIDLDAPPLVRGPVVPEDAYLVIQTGGFNTWLDVETLLRGLEAAMRANPRVHFAATGGAIPGHHREGFERFAAQIEAGPFRERFHLLGWVPLGRVPRLILEGDVGLNVDLACAEGRLGTRNRLLDWVLGGLPVITTPGCELAEELAREGFATRIPHEDPEALAAAVLGAAAGPRRRDEPREAGPAYLRRAHNPPLCLAPLLEWAAAPKSASDLQAWSRGTAAPPELVRQAREVAGALDQARRKAEKLAWLERRLARLEGSRLVRLALKLRGRDDLEADPPPGGS